MSEDEKKVTTVIMKVGPRGAMFDIYEETKEYGLCECGHSHRCHDRAFTMGQIGCVACGKQCSGYRERT